MTEPRLTLEQLATAEVERIIQPYLDYIPAEDVEAFKEILRDELVAHPAYEQILKAKLPREAPDQSGEVERETGKPVEQSEDELAKAGGGGR